MTVSPLLCCSNKRQVVIIGAVSGSVIVIVVLVVGCLLCSRRSRSQKVNRSLKERMRQDEERGAIEVSEGGGEGVNGRGLPMLLGIAKLWAGFLRHAFIL